METMKNYEIKITGSGTQNQIAVRLLELGRMLQIATDDSEFLDKSLEDGCLLTEITGILGADEKREQIRLMAKFMGYIDNGDDDYLVHPETNYDHSIDDPEWFLYSSSWDWLMPVVQKIESLGYLVDVFNNSMSVHHKDGNGIVDIGNKELGKLEIMYKGALEFIRWYNVYH